jgi:hypothetical protein
LLISLSPSRKAHSFPIDQVPELHDITDIDRHASDSEVIFLINATPEDKQGNQEFVTENGKKGEFTRNIGKHHHYVVVFDRDGNFKRVVQLDSSFVTNGIAVFPTGSFLASGYDESSHVPKLAFLNDDGTIIKYLQVRDGALPESALNKGPEGKGPEMYVSPVQLVRHEDSIVVLQNKTNFPILEIKESGAIRVIRPRLPREAQIDTLIPSDTNLFARVNEPGGGSIYELNW